MKNQVLSNRYIDRKDLVALLIRLFGSNYFLEVGNIAYYIYFARLICNCQQTKGDSYVLQVDRSLTKVVLFRLRRTNYLVSKSYNGSG